MKNKYQKSLDFVDELIAKTCCKSCWNKPKESSTKYCNECSFSKTINTLQQAIDDLEIYKKALYLNLKADNCLLGTPPKKILKQQIEEDTNFYLELARKELENEKTQTNADS